MLELQASRVLLVRKENLELQGLQVQPVCREQVV